MNATYDPTTRGELPNTNDRWIVGGYGHSIASIRSKSAGNPPKMRRNGTWDYTLPWPSIGKRSKSDDASYDAIVSRAGAEDKPWLNSREGDREAAHA